MSLNGVSLDLNGKVALVSGGSRGIGAATVRMFVRAGAKVAFSYEKAKDSADKLVGELGNDKCAAIQSELSSTDAARKLVEATISRFGKLDALVANHGIWPPNDAAIDEMTDDQWSRTMRINLDSVFGLIKYSVAQMKKQNAGKWGKESSGHVVIISSTAGQRGEAYHADYAASKGAIISMVKGLSTELAPQRIHVNCVAPGWVATDMAKPALEDSVTREKIFKTIPLGRVGKPEEIAACILFLCTDHAGFISGEILNVNGGAVLVG